MPAGTQWLVWRFETDSTLADALSGSLGRFPECLEDMFLSSRRCGCSSDRGPGPLCMFSHLPKVTAGAAASPSMCHPSATWQRRPGAGSRHTCRSQLLVGFRQAALLLKRRPGDDVKRAALVVKVVMKQLFVALKRLHAMGIVHRDIKPVQGVRCPAGSITCLLCTVAIVLGLHEGLCRVRQQDRATLPVRVRGGLHGLC